MLIFLSVRRRELLSGVLFRPSVVVLAFVALGLGLPALDHAAATPSAPFVFHGDPAAARSVLSTVATSLITVAALSFSLMLVTLQLVSSQFTPRAIRGLLADGTHQLTIGTFVGIFAYCLLVTRVVRDESDVTGWSVSVAILLGVAGLGLLVVFIHNLSQSVKVSHIAARTARATLAALDDLYPHPYERTLAEPLPRGKVPYEGTQLRAWRSGYIQTMRVQAIVDAAPRLMHIRARPGDFVTKAAVLVSLDGDSTPRGLEATVRHAVHIAEERAVEQDSRYGMRLLADIALRALSPGINDPTTAVMCIHHLGACLAELVGRAMPSPERRISKHGVSVLVDRVTFAEHLDEAFGELITFVSGHPLVIMELASVLERAADCARNVGAGDRGDAIDRLTQSVRELAQRDAPTEHGRTMAPVDRSLDQYGGDELRK